MDYNLFLADIIYLIHLSFVIVMLIAPYVNMKIFHKFYYVMVPTLFLRWLTNYSKCSVTMFESKLRGIKECDGFIYRIITPIYKFKCEKTFNIALYIYMSVTWFWIRKKLNIH